jgi:hypothetical protein
VKETRKRGLHGSSAVTITRTDPTPRNDERDAESSSFKPSEDRKREPPATSLNRRTHA